jgi:hypothetical protein
MHALAPPAAGLAVLTLAGCAGGGLGGMLGNAAPAVAMTGRWMLAAPAAPPCGLEFGNGDNAQSGTITPDGGCPGQFHRSRRWAFEDGLLVIKSDDNEALARLEHAGGRFAGRAMDGIAVTLAR